ncbi:MAG: FGGY family carbohydrate kinase [Planctomycetota bacterium]
MLILAIDLGTTGNRALVFDEQLRVRARSYREFPQIYPQPGWVEHDPEVIWQTTVAVIREAADALDGESIGAVALTNQRETCCGWDRDTGRAHGNAIVWQDRRTAATCAGLAATPVGARIRERTGLRCDPYFSATKWAWMREHGRLPSDAALGTIDSWILYRLTGGAVHRTDITNASRTMLFDIAAQDWDPELCAAFGIDPRHLPRVEPCDGAFGSTATEAVGFAAPIRAVAGDQHAALFAQGGYNPTVIKNTYGTGLFVLANVGEKIPQAEGLLATPAWRLGGRTEYALEGGAFSGGASVQWLRDGLELITGANETGELAASLSDNGEVYFVPALAGLGAPHWDADARGMLIGITRATTRAHLVRAALEAAAYRTRDIVAAFSAHSGHESAVLRADGGACANAWLMQFQADILGCEVLVPAVTQTTALGVTGMAGIAAGVWPDRQAFQQHVAIDRHYRPHMPAAHRERLYARWCDALDRARAWHRSD